MGNPAIVERQKATTEILDFVQNDGLEWSSEEAVFAGHFDAEVFVGEAGGDAAAGGAVEEADLDEEGFVDLFEGVLLFGQRGGEGVEADRAAVIFFDDGAQQAAVEFVEAVGVDLEQGERGLGGGAVDFSVARTWAKSRTRRRRRLAMRGVPRERMAISAAPSWSMGTLSTSAERWTTKRSSSSV